MNVAALFRRLAVWERPVLLTVQRLHFDERRGDSCSFSFLCFCCSWCSRPAVRRRLQLRAKNASKNRPVQRYGLSGRVIRRILGTYAINPGASFSFDADNKATFQSRSSLRPVRSDPGGVRPIRAGVPTMSPLVARDGI
jgi:hypothetical protein